jgi:hypothetical protein
MTDPSTIRRALDLALQARSYARIGPVGAELAAATSLEFDAAIRGWASGDSAALATEADALVAAHDDLDRGRNHLMKDFNLRFGPDRSGWTAQAREELAQGIAGFTGRKERAVAEAAGRLAARFQQREVGA